MYIFVWATSQVEEEAPVSFADLGGWVTRRLAIKATPTTSSRPYSSSRGRPPRDTLKAIQYGEGEPRPTRRVHRRAVDSPSPPCAFRRGFRFFGPGENFVSCFFPGGPRALADAFSHRPVLPLRPLFLIAQFTIDELRKQMDNKNNIRNMSVIAHVDHVSQAAAPGSKKDRGKKKPKR